MFSISNKQHPITDLEHPYAILVNAKGCFRLVIGECRSLIEDPKSSGCR
jgi:hypothetical protein